MHKLMIPGLLIQILAWYPASVSAGGTCILHPSPFKLRSDSVYWSIKIKPGAECIQGLRWSTIMIDSITIVDPPKLGRLVIEGPAFRYFADPDAEGNDHFKIAIKGTSLHIAGTSTIEVGVSSQ
ncbi:hypothetical protein JQ615_17215 [Bradyrhizobium jicamae]|uniref:Uncharacterized protein n=1 Tax=Bradyrhizobium jicamae TaxID=280332 RepID=A0ABS5FK26_9BRAD|nr:hypothetical protein [Bradyrhizobium jicamae]MBR0797134.1 hypothetical protein [Bradyrhizobium jicamae]